MPELTLEAVLIAANRHGNPVTSSASDLFDDLPDKREANDRKVLADTMDHTKWLGLAVIKADDSQDHGVGFVEFVAFYEHKGVGQVHENSRFVTKEGRWYYCDGQMLPSVVWGRNQSCWCGSKKKFKKCHGK